jgi:hypothetical protein
MSDARRVRWHPADDNSEVAVMLLRGEVATSAWYDLEQVKISPAESVQGY